jgi:CheY-like chemotaxis protein
LPLLQGRDQSRLRVLPTPDGTGLEVLRFLRPGGLTALLQAGWKVSLFKNFFKRKKKILIVEDDAQTAFLLSEFLKLHEFDTALAKNGIEGIEMAEKDRPDLIFLDILLPKMAGNEVLSILKSKPGTKGIPVVMCTALNTLNEVEDCCKSGAASYITKPYDLNRVLEKVNSIIS